MNWLASFSLILPIDLVIKFKQNFPFIAYFLMRRQIVQLIVYQFHFMFVKHELILQV